MKRILIATHNTGKLREILEVLGDLPVEFVSLNNIGICEDVEETGKTHEENAKLKAEFYHNKSVGLHNCKNGLSTIAEDSGIYVDAFPGDFGVYTRRWKGLHGATDEQWIQVFLSEISKLPSDKRTARFVCAAHYIETHDAVENVPRRTLDGFDFRGERSFSVIGETRGIIIPELAAPLIPGIPISSCFIPDGYKKVYAALSVSEKNKVSHRGKAMHRLKEFLTPAG